MSVTHETLKRVPGQLRGTILNTILVALTVSGVACAQDTAGKKEKSIAPASRNVARAAFPQASGARAAYSESVSAPVRPVFTKADKDKKPAKEVTPPSRSSRKESTIKVGSVKITGNSAFSTEELQSLISDNYGKKLTFSQIKGMASTIENHYHDRGYRIAKVIVPKQNMKSGGALQLQVLEGRLGDVNVTGNKRYSEKRIKDTFYAYNQEGKALTMSEIERPLVMLNSRSGISVSSTLSPGADTGLTNVGIEVKEEPRVKGTIEFNNFGSDDSGKYRFIPYIALPNMTGAGDELGFFGIVSPDSIDSWYWQSSYARPINNHGTSLNAYYGKGNNQIGNEYAILDIKGENSSGGMGISHRIVYSAKTSLEFQSWFEWQDMEQTMLGYRTSNDNVRKLRIGVNFDHTDSEGRSYVSFNIHQGLGELMGGMDNNDYYSSRSYAKADNGFTKAVLSIMRLQNFNQRLYGIFSLTAQYSVDPLVSGEQMYIGGASTVRGQPQSFYSGDSGILFNAELRYSVLPDAARLQLATFFDCAQTQIKHPIIGQEQWSRLAGAGVGIRSNIYEGLDLRLDLAAPVGPREGNRGYIYGQVRYSF